MAKPLLIVVDVEADGELPGVNSMVCFGAVVVDEKLDKTFYGQTAPISTIYNPDALAISGFTREQHKKFPEASLTMIKFLNWIESLNRRVVCISDNPAFDFAYINYYFHTYCGKNPFGWSARRIGDLWCGAKGDLSSKWKYLRKTIHDHNPVNDAIGNAEALLEMEKMGLFNLPK